MKEKILSYVKKYWQIVLSVAAIAGLFIGAVFVTANQKNDKSADKKETSSSEVAASPKSSVTPSIVPSQSPDGEQGNVDQNSSNTPENYSDDTTGVQEMQGKSTTPLTIQSTSYDDVCSQIASYVESNSKYTNIPVQFLDDDGVTPLWNSEKLDSYSSEDPKYADLEKWTTDAVDSSGNDPYPVITALIQHTDTGFIVHGLSAGENFLIDDGYCPENAWSK